MPVSANTNAALMQRRCIDFCAGTPPSHGFVDNFLRVAGGRDGHL